MQQKIYDESFKLNAVSLVEAGTPAAQVARDLGISPYLVYTWRSQYGAKPSTHGNVTRNLKTGILLHSDRGVQYSSDA